MFPDIEVLSPKKVIRVQHDLEIEKRKDKDKKKEIKEETDEYIITNLMESGSNIPRLMVRIPTNLNKLLTDELEDIEVIDEIKLDNKTEELKKSKSFKINLSNETLKLIEKEETDTDIERENEYKVETLEGKSDSDSDSYEDEEDDDEYDEENEKNLFKSFKSRYLEKYKPNVYNENMSFLRDHTKNELTHFIRKKNMTSSTEIKINDIINIDYNKLNEKSIIPYFLTSMYDIEQRKKRERIKKEMQEKRKASIEKQKRKSANDKKRKSFENAKGSRKGKGKGREELTKTKSLKGKKLEHKIENNTMKKEAENEDEYNDDKENYTGELDEYEEEENEMYEKSTDTKKGIHQKKEKKKKDNENEDEEFDEEKEINIYNDPNIYGIEGSSDYSEGFKTDEENIQEEEDMKEDNVPMVSSLSTVTNQTDTKKKKKEKRKKQ